MGCCSSCCTKRERYKLHVRAAVNEGEVDDLGGYGSRTRTQLQNVGRYLKKQIVARENSGNVSRIRNGMRSWISLLENCADDIGLYEIHLLDSIDHVMHIGHDKFIQHPSQRLSEDTKEYLLWSMRVLQTMLPIIKSRPFPHHRLHDYYRMLNTVALGPVIQQQSEQQNAGDTPASLAAVDAQVSHAHSLQHMSSVPALAARTPGPLMSTLGLPNTMASQSTLDTEFKSPETAPVNTNKSEDLFELCVTAMETIELMLDNCLMEVSKEFFGDLLFLSLCYSYTLLLGERMTVDSKLSGAAEEKSSESHSIQSLIKKQADSIEEVALRCFYTLCSWVSLHSQNELKEFVILMAKFGWDIVFADRVFTKLFQYSKTTPLEVTKATLQLILLIDSESATMDTVALWLRMVNTLIELANQVEKGRNPYSIVLNLCDCFKVLDKVSIVFKAEVPVSIDAKFYRFDNGASSSGMLSRSYQSLDTLDGYGSPVSMASPVPNPGPSDSPIKARKSTSTGEDSWLLNLGFRFANACLKCIAEYVTNEDSYSILERGILPRLFAAEGYHHKVYLLSTALLTVMRRSNRNVKHSMPTRIIQLILKCRELGVGQTKNDLQMRCHLLLQTLFIPKYVSKASPPPPQPIPEEKATDETGRITVVIDSLKPMVTVPSTMELDVDEMDEEVDSVEPRVSKAMKKRALQRHKSVEKAGDLNMIEKQAMDNILYFETLLASSPVSDKMPFPPLSLEHKKWVYAVCFEELQNQLPWELMKRMTLSLTATFYSLRRNNREECSEFMSQLLLPFLMSLHEYADSLSSRKRKNKADGGTSGTGSSTGAGPSSIVTPMAESNADDGAFGAFKVLTPVPSSTPPTKVDVPPIPDLFHAASDTLVVESESHLITDEREILGVNIHSIVLSLLMLFIRHLKTSAAQQNLLSRLQEIRNLRCMNGEMLNDFMVDQYGRIELATENLQVNTSALNLPGMKSGQSTERGANVANVLAEWFEPSMTREASIIPLQRQHSRGPSGASSVDQSTHSSPRVANNNNPADKQAIPEETEFDFPGSVQPTVSMTGTMIAGGKPSTTELSADSAGIPPDSDVVDALASIAVSPAGSSQVGSGGGFYERSRSRMWFVHGIPWDTLLPILAEAIGISSKTDKEEWIDSCNVIYDPEPYLNLIHRMNVLNDGNTGRFLHRAGIGGVFGGGGGGGGSSFDSLSSRNGLFEDSAVSDYYGKEELMRGWEDSLFKEEAMLYSSPQAGALSAARFDDDVLGLMTNVTATGTRLWTEFDQRALVTPLEKAPNLTDSGSVFVNQWKHEESMNELFFARMAQSTLESMELDYVQSHLLSYSRKRKKKKKDKRRAHFHMVPVSITGHSTSKGHSAETEDFLIKDSEVTSSKKKSGGGNESETGGEFAKELTRKVAELAKLSGPTTTSSATDSGYGGSADTAMASHRKRRRKSVTMDADDGYRGRFDYFSPLFADRAASLAMANDNEIYKSGVFADVSLLDSFVFSAMDGATLDPKVSVFLSSGMSSTKVGGGGAGSLAGAASSSSSAAGSKAGKSSETIGERLGVTEFEFERDGALKSHVLSQDTYRLSGVDVMFDYTGERGVYGYTDSEDSDSDDRDFADASQLLLSPTAASAGRSRIHSKDRRQPKKKQGFLGERQFRAFGRSIERGFSKLRKMGASSGHESDSSSDSTDEEKMSLARTELSTIGEDRDMDGDGFGTEDSEEEKKYAADDSPVGGRNSALSNPVPPQTGGLSAYTTPDLIMSSRISKPGKSLPITADLSDLPNNGSERVIGDS